ncbi:heparinase II/III family protein [Roseibium sp. RKSG952]|uniref:heparinase II/III domain-containing protein n=1 Tax=Roseibium sp. RKSG952 TaxID=2529384 RepID=UPI0012BCC81A|nr:heparinase II/III family protein [Roseibium sp. RKSG952]MTI01174.1 hypothetical protein [Roseibium sp. RKSG952]
MPGAILWPREQARYTSDHHIGLWLNGEIEIVKNLGTMQIPANPDWTEDPYNSRIHAAYYQSMGWAYAGEAAFRAGQFDEFPEYVKNLILDFATDNSDGGQPTHLLTYHDGTNAFRLSNIAYWYETYLKPEAGYGISFTDEEAALLRNSLEIQRDQVLYQLSQEEHWAGNNHRFFHSMALSSYASVFGEVDPASALHETDAASLLAYGLNVVEEIINTLVYTEEGVTSEQSFTYHRLDLGLVLEAIQSISSQGYELGVDFEGLITRMYEFDLLSRRPADEKYDMYVSEVGDTFFGGLSGAFYINQVARSGEYLSPVSQWITSRGKEGTRPADLNHFEQSGYVIVRPEYVWEDDRDMRVLIDATPALHSHGHYDNSNVLLSLFGERILVDSGGPYSYDNINPFGYDFGYSDSLKEFYFEHSQAHNVVLVDGVSSDSDTNILSVTDTDAYSAVSLQRDFNYVINVPAPELPDGMTPDLYQTHMRETYDTISMERDVVVLKEAGVTFVFDYIDNKGSGSHDYTLGWHFDPAAYGLTASLNPTFSQNGIHGDVAFAGSDGLELGYFNGFAGEDRMQGWVSPGFYEIEAAPVVELQLNDLAGDAWFAAAFTASREEAPELVMATETTDGGGYLCRVEYDGYVYEVLGDGQGGCVVNLLERPDPATIDTGPRPVAKGTNADDWVVGTEGNDVLNGYAGIDRVEGGAGDDRIIGGFGDDYILGGAGNDIIYDLRDSNTVEDGDGIDRVSLGAGTDRVVNGSGNDLIRLGAGDDTIVLGAGKDRLYGQDGFDTAIVNGSKSSHTAVVRDDHVLLWDRDASDGDLGRNYLFDVERITFEGSYDQIFIDDEAVNLYEACIGNDTYVLGGGNDIIDCGAGADDVILRGHLDDFDIRIDNGLLTVIDLNTSDGDLGTNQIQNAEAINFTDRSSGTVLFGSEAGERQTGTKGNDVVLSSAGNDDIRTYDGDDSIQLGEGNDRCYAGDGFDVLQVDAAKGDFSFFARGSYSVLWDRLGDNGDLGRNYLYDVERIDFSGTDTIFIDGLAINAYADGAGSDTYVLGAGNDVIQAGEGYDDVIVLGMAADFELVDLGTHWQLTDLDLSDGDFGSNSLYGVDKIAFGDSEVIL